MSPSNDQYFSPIGSISFVDKTSESKVMHVSPTTDAVSSTTDNMSNDLLEVWNAVFNLSQLKRSEMCGSDDPPSPISSSLNITPLGLGLSLQFSTFGSTFRGMGDLITSKS
uniref:Putative ovule protein n=1 Tax=Solanum chacoense TaxID=4108 RepID=A0A0V0IGH2_SOLCH